METAGGIQFPVAVFVFKFSFFSLFKFSFIMVKVAGSTIEHQVVAAKYLKDSVSVMLAYYEKRLRSVQKEFKALPVTADSNLLALELKLLHDFVEYLKVI